MLFWFAVIFGAIAFGLTSYLLSWVIVHRGKGFVPSEEKLAMTMNPLEQILWRCTHAHGKRVVGMVTWNQRRVAAMLLARSGLAEWDVGQLYVFKLACGSFLAIGLGFVQGQFVYWTEWGIFNIGLLGLVALIGFECPCSILRRRVRTRQLAMLKDLPAFMDLLILGLESGMNLQGSLQLALEYCRAGALRSEWARVLNDIRAGQPRSHALKQMAIRTNIPAIRQLVNAMIQAETAGFSVSAIIRGHSKQQRRERLITIEKRAMEAPVRMLFPLALCMFPCTFLVLGIPIAAQFLVLE